MEPLNDNGPRPENYPQPPTARKDRTIPLIVCLSILGVLVLAAFMMFTVTFFAVRHYNTATTTFERDTVVLFELTETGRDISSEFPNLSVIRIGNSLSHGDKHLAVGDVTRLNITMRNGGLTFTVHDEPYIWLHSSDSPRYEFSNNRQTLDISVGDGSLIVFVPYSRNEAIFEDISVNGRDGSITIWGIGDDNVFLSENLHVHNRNGSINLGDVIISSYLELETRDGSINLHNVIADADRLSIATRNGWVNISE